MTQFTLNLAHEVSDKTAEKILDYLNQAMLYYSNLAGYELNFEVPRSDFTYIESDSGDYDYNLIELLNSIQNIINNDSESSL